MRANFTRADGGRLGLRFEPETFEEQLLLEQFTQNAHQLGHRFEFSGWAHNHPRTLREGLTSCWGQLVQRETARADKINEESQEAKESFPRAVHSVHKPHTSLQQLEAALLQQTTDHVECEKMLRQQIRRLDVERGLLREWLYAALDHWWEWVTGISRWTGETNGQEVGFIYDYRDRIEDRDGKGRRLIEQRLQRTHGTLSTEQRGVLMRFQESCRVIGAHEGCASWAVLGCALEAALAAVDLGSMVASVYREQLEAYLARSDAGYGMAGIEEALRTLLVVTEAKGEGKGPNAQAPRSPIDMPDRTCGYDGLSRPGPADDVTGCPSDECQIRQQCTSATECRRMESEVGRQIAALKRSYNEALAGYEAIVEPLKRERDEALRRAEELAEARTAMQREVERFSLLVREARDEADGQRTQITVLKRQLDEDAEAKRRMLDWLETIAQAAGSRFQDGPAVVGAIEAVKTERDAACRELSQDRNDVGRTIVTACRDGLARLEHAIDAHPGLCRLTASRAECVISYAACRAQCLVQSTADHGQMKQIWAVDRTLDAAIERLIADLDEWTKVLAERIT